MRLAALFSGGKDSTYAIHLAEKLGYKVSILLTVEPASDESYYFHYPNIWITRLQAEAMEKNLLTAPAGASKDEELQALITLIDRVSGEIDGILSGVVKSGLQYRLFKKICEERGLKLVTPLWNQDPFKLLRQMIGEGFKIMIVGVAAEGLGKELLGKTLDDKLMEFLEERSKRYGISPIGEGGEFETLVLDAPIFKKRIEILDYEIRWSGYDGFIKIKDAKLVKK